MGYINPKGAEWSKWDLHVHTPASLVQHFKATMANIGLMLLILKMILVLIKFRLSSLHLSLLMIENFIIPYSLLTITI